MTITILSTGVPQGLVETTTSTSLRQPFWAKYQRTSTSLYTIHQMLVVRRWFEGVPQRFACRTAWASSFESFRPVSNLHGLPVLQTYPNREHEIVPSDLHSTPIFNAVCVPASSSAAWRRYKVYMSCSKGTRVYLKLVQTGLRTDTVINIAHLLFSNTLYSFVGFVLVVRRTSLSDVG